MVKYDLRRTYNKVKGNKVYMIMIIALFLLFGKTGMGSRLLTFPPLRYIFLYFIVNYRIKEPWTSIYVVLFVYVCFQVVSYIDIDGGDGEDFDEEDSDDLENA